MRYGQFRFITYLVLVGFVIAFLSLGLGGVINTGAQQGIQAAGMSGLEAFFYSNIVGIMLLALGVSIFAVLYFGGGA